MCHVFNRENEENIHQRICWSDQRSCYTPSPVSTWMGDHISAQLQVQKIYICFTNHPGQLSLAIPLWVGTMRTGQRVGMICGRGVNASMAHVWWQVKLCDPLYNTCHT